MKSLLHLFLWGEAYSSGVAPEDGTGVCPISANLFFVRDELKKNNEPMNGYAIF